MLLYMSVESAKRCKPSRTYKLLLNEIYVDVLFVDEASLDSLRYASCNGGEALLGIFAREQGDAQLAHCEHCWRDLLKRFAICYACQGSLYLSRVGFEET